MEKRDPDNVVTSYLQKAEDKSLSCKVEVLAAFRLDASQNVIVSDILLSFTTLNLAQYIYFDLKSGAAISTYLPDAFERTYDFLPLDRYCD